MRALYLICDASLFIALFKLPIGYYTFLRIVITIGALIAVVHEYKGEFNFWVLAFGLIAIVFNPLFPVYLNNKSAWQPIDLVTGIIFSMKAFRNPLK